MPSDALDYITVQGFKSIASVKRLRLGPVNVLIGSNGSGKSNFIGVFGFLSAIREGRLRAYVTASGGAEKVLHFGSKTTEQVHLHLLFGGESNQYQLILSPTEDDGLYPSDERAYFRDETDAPQFVHPKALRASQQGREAGISDPESGRLDKWVRDYLERWRIYHFHDTSSSSAMRKTARVNDNAFLRPDGSNLAAFLYYLQQKREDTFRLIQRTVQGVTPFFDSFRLAPLRLNPDDIRLEWRHRDSDQYFGASSLSDGTLRFIALVTVLLQPEEIRPSLILLDEPELGLHPFAIEILASLIRQASARTQIIVATQSSLLLDHFDPEDVLVADRVAGATQFSRLDPARLAAWLEDYSLGQLWEKNELGGRPAPD